MREQVLPLLAAHNPGSKKKAALVYDSINNAVWIRHVTLDVLRKEAKEQCPEEGIEVLLPRHRYIIYVIYIIDIIYVICLIYNRHNISIIVYIGSAFAHIRRHIGSAYKTCNIHTI